jgi:SAM-dependent methyltransferase
MVDRLFSERSLARVYDAFCVGREDFGFYLPLVAGARAVLDVGCGTGELLRRARAGGHRGRLCGLDPAAAMLEVARQRADVEWVLGDLDSADERGVLDGEFDLVVMTGHAFQVLTDDAQIARVLSAVRQLLAPGGRFAFETRNPVVRAWEGWTREEVAVVDDPDLGPVRYWREVVTPFDGELLTFTHTFTGPRWDAPQHARSTLRFLTAERLDAFLAAAGFEVAERYGGFGGEAYAAEAAEIVTVAVAAG